MCNSMLIWSLYLCEIIQLPFVRSAVVISMLYQCLRQKITLRVNFPSFKCCSLVIDDQKCISRFLWCIQFEIENCIQGRPLQFDVDMALFQPSINAPKYKVMNNIDVYAFILFIQNRLRLLIQRMILQITDQSGYTILSLLHMLKFFSHLRCIKSSLVFLVKGKMIPAFYLQD